MTRIVAAGLVVLALARITSADSAVDVEAFPHNEFVPILKERTVTLDSQAADEIAKFVAGLEKPSAKMTGFVEKLSGANKTATFEDLMPILTADGNQAICAKLVKHDDPILQFLASLNLAGSGDSEAAKGIYDLIHSDKPSLQEKRLLKTWSVGIGIRPGKDNAAAILDHLKSAMGRKAKFKPGDAAPDFEATSTAGEPLSLKELKGKIVVLHFWSTWCGPCMAMMNLHIQQLANYSNDEVAIIFVSIDDDRKLFDEAVKKHQMPYHNVFDAGGWGGPLARLFGVNQLPFDVVIGDGKVISNSIEDIGGALAKKSKK